MVQMLNAWIFITNGNEHDSNARLAVLRPTFIINEHDSNAQIHNNSLNYIWKQKWNNSPFYAKILKCPASLSLDANYPFLWNRFLFTVKSCNMFSCICARVITVQLLILIMWFNQILLLAGAIQRYYSVILCV